MLCSGSGYHFQTVHGGEVLMSHQVVRAWVSLVQADCM